jgi:hypothetical protein
VVLPNLLSKHLLADLRVEFDRLRTPDPIVFNHCNYENGSLAVARSNEVRRSGRYPALCEIFANDYLGEVVAGYIGYFYRTPLPIDLHAQIEIEANVRPGVTDNSIWHFDRVAAIKCMIYLSDVTSDAGAIQFIPGSHGATRTAAAAHLRINPDPLFIDNYCEGVNELKAVTISGPAGTIVVLDTCCIHRGGIVTGLNSRSVIRTVTWPPILNMSYLTLPTADQSALNGVRRFHPHDRAGQKVKDPLHLFRDH